MYGAFIRAARERRGITRAALAEKIGLTDDGLYKIESDRNAAKLETLDAIAGQLNMLVGDLLPNSCGGEGVPDILQPLLAPLLALDRSDARDLVLNLASQARLMLAWHNRDAAHIPKTEERMYTSGPNSNSTDDLRDVAGLNGAPSTGEIHARNDAATAAASTASHRSRKAR